MKHLLVDISPLREHREFRLLWSGQAVTFLGSMITYVAIPYQVFQITGSTLLVGLLGAVEFVAVVSTALVGGALADAVDRRLMVRVTEGALLLCSVALVVNAQLEDPSVGLLFGLAGLMTVFDALQRPSLDALLPRLVPREQVLAAGALNALKGTGGMIVGPALGGLLIAWLGLPGTYSVDVATFFVSLLLLQRMKAVPPPPDAERPSLRGIVEGLRYARSRPELMGTYLVDMNAMFFGMPNALFPAIAAGYGGASVLGLLYSAPAVGSMLATLTSGWTKRVRRHGLAVIWAAGLWGVAIIVFGLAQWLWLALLALALAGAADMVSGLFRMAIWNMTIPDRLRGRLAGVEMISYASGPTLGNVEAGAVSSLTTPRFSAGLGGVLCVVGTIALALALPEFRRYESGEPEHDPAGADVGLGEHDLDARP
ncbi:MAG: MFS transporter [Actinomycetota bacterium]|nr:MFS transporter [Actinomycetota bacterium]